jgi:hypothetical protein
MARAAYRGYPGLPQEIEPPIEGDRMRKPSTWLAAIALFLALGGTSLAAKHYLINSTKQIKPSVLKALQGRSGPKGATGPAGAAGSQGPAGPSNLSSLTLVNGPEEPVATGPSVGSASATCPAGQHAVSGGGAIISEEGHLTATVPSADHQSWLVVGVNLGVGVAKIKAYVNCAATGAAVAARSNAQARASAAREARSLAAQLEAKIRAGRHRGA